MFFGRTLPTRRPFVALFCAATFAGCAHAPPPVVVEKRVEVKVRAPSLAAVQSQHAKEAFESSTLSGAQKKQLRELYSSATEEQTELCEKISETQTDLMKLLVDSEARDEDVELLKNRILELDRARTSLNLRTLDEAESILGRKELRDERIYRAFLLLPATAAAATTSTH